jgi:hypothetical protein
MSNAAQSVDGRAARGLARMFSARVSSRRRTNPADRVDVEPGKPPPVDLGLGQLLFKSDSYTYVQRDSLRN